MIPPELQERLKKIKLVIFDNDGVLTDGRIVYGDYGDELKFFDVQDGFGMVLLRRAGIETAILSAKKSKINRRRAKELMVSQVYEKISDKLKTYEKALKKFKVAPDEVCYVGDDLIDLPVLRRVGFAAAVPNAVADVREAAHYVTQRPGGGGAVRELAEMLLKAQGLWIQATEKYFK